MSELYKAYFLAEKKRQGRFWQVLDEVNEKIDAPFVKIKSGPFGKGKHDGAYAMLLGIGLLSLAAPTAGNFFFCAWLANVGLTTYSDFSCGARADKAMVEDLAKVDLMDSASLDRFIHEQKSRLSSLGAARVPFAAAVRREVAAAPTSAPQPPRPGPNR